VEFPFGINPGFVLSGFIVGVLVGQTGVGGGSLMTPILVVLFGISPAAAVGTDLLYASATKTVGTLVHGINHTVDWRVVGRMAAGSAPATLLTLVAMSYFDLNSPAASRRISLILGIMLVLTALSLLGRRWLFRRFPRVTRSSPERVAHRMIGPMTTLMGAALGVLVTISSVGAGALGVTALLFLYPRLPMAVIVGSDIAHAVPLTLIAGAGHWWLGSVNWMLLATLLCGSIPGIMLGSYLLPRMPEVVSRTVLGLVLLTVAGKLLW
jgi:uncharacterized membrane protein YfcA